MGADPVVKHPTRGCARLGGGGGPVRIATLCTPCTRGRVLRHVCRRDRLWIVGSFYFMCCWSRVCVYHYVHQLPARVQRLAAFQRFEGSNPKTNRLITTLFYCFYCDLKGFVLPYIYLLRRSFPRCIPGKNHCADIRLFGGRLDPCNRYIIPICKARKLL